MGKWMGGLDGCVGGRLVVECVGEWVGGWVGSFRVKQALKS